MDTQTRRPDGISVIAVLNVVGGVLMMLAAFAAPQGALGALQFGFGVCGPGDRHRAFPPAPLGPVGGYWRIHP
jgi:hypothetical protein